MNLDFPFSDIPLIAQILMKNSADWLKINGDHITVSVMWLYKNSNSPCVVTISPIGSSVEERLKYLEEFLEEIYSSGIEEMVFSYEGFAPVGKDSSELYRVLTVQYLTKNGQRTWWAGIKPDLDISSWQEIKLKQGHNVIWHKLNPERWN